MRRALATVAAVLALPAAARATGPTRYVDPMIGTLGAGFVFPGADVPFGMVQNSPDTFTPGAGYQGLVYGGYMGNDPQIRDFSLVHLSGPGVPKAGDLPFMPWVGAGGRKPPSDPAQYATPFAKAGEQAAAGFYGVTLANGTRVELTSSTHAAMQRYAFPPTGDADLIVDPWHRNSGTAQGSWRATGDREIAGQTRNDRYAVFFAARFDQPIVASGRHWLRFPTGSTVTMRVGISFVDEDGARRNLDAEAPAARSFQDMRAAADAAWDAELAKIRVSGGTPADRRTFYTALYHSLLHPNVVTDVDGRYRGFDGAIHDAGGRVQYANFSSWDTYKALNQLQATIEPDRYADMLRSLLADARQGGALPRWGEQSYDAGHMSGDPAIPMIADGICRGLVRGAEAQALYEQAVALRARRDPALDGLGYLPMKPGTTLEYGVADFALALMAQRLGHLPDAQRLLAASLRYRNVLDPQTKWVRPRNADGSWYGGDTPLGFQPTEETGFQEGNSWQYSWLVPQDPRGLFDRMGGDAVAAQRLDTLFAAPPEAQNRLNAFGTVYRDPQWAPGNETDLGAPYLYAFARRPWKTQAQLRAAQQVYRPEPEGLPGNDDLGGMSGWYVWTALGFGPFTPGAPLYMVGAPLFERASIALPKGRFTVEAPGASLAGRYVQSATLDGRPLDRAWFGADALRRGGVLRLDMGVTPNRAWGANELPPSASDAPLSAFGC